MNSTMPTYFIPHGGGPCFFMDWSITGDAADTWNSTADWLRHLSGSLPSRPRAIVVVSGHWEEPEFAAANTATPSLIYDYTGFPPHTYKLQYPAPGAPALAQRVVDLLTEAGLPARTDAARGFDHGIFIPFLLLFPNADIPIVPLSLHASLDPTLHLNAGRALRSLRNDGVLIVGSGMSYHNMRGFRTPTGAEHSEIFDRWLTGTLTDHNPGQRWQNLTQWSKAPAARQSHPREEHLLPLMVAAGAASEEAGQRVFSDTVMRGARISGYRFG
ncbi:MAG TPA: class III extradiol ring-cleavage dioxygenase [Steroidobacteraceae bacterium]|jgi:aromatic ring-opening dioxygenase catalytic subunit (LigB family)